MPIDIGVVDVDEIADVALNVVAWNHVAVLGGAGELLHSESHLRDHLLANLLAGPLSSDVHLEVGYRQCQW